MRYLKVILLLIALCFLNNISFNFLESNSENSWSCLLKFLEGKMDKNRVDNIEARSFLIMYDCKWLSTYLKVQMSAKIWNFWTIQLFLNLSFFMFFDHSKSIRRANVLYRGRKKTWTRGWECNWNYFLQKAVWLHRFIRRWTTCVEHSGNYVDRYLCASIFLNTFF